MEPPFGDAFQNCSFADQALTSTDLLANNSDPDFMYELVSNPQCPQYPQFYFFFHITGPAHNLQQGKKQKTETFYCGVVLICSLALVKSWPQFHLIKKRKRTSTTWLRFVLNVEINSQSVATAANLHDFSRSKKKKITFLK